MKNVDKAVIRTIIVALAFFLYAGYNGMVADQYMIWVVLLTLFIATFIIFAAILVVLVGVYTVFCLVNSEKPF